MDMVSNIVTGTPWWVWFLLIYVLIKGYKATQNQVVHLYRLLIIPVIFIILSIHSLTIIPLDWIKIVIFLIAGLAGIAAGFWQISRLFVQVDRKKRLIQTPGSWIPLILIIIIFASKYYFGYSIAVDPGMTHYFWFGFSLLLISGLCVGMFIGRSACYICRYLSLPHQDLKAKG